MSGFELVERGGSRKTAREPSGRRCGDNPIIGSLNNGQREIKTGCGFPGGTTGANYLVNNRDGEGYLANCLAYGWIVEVGGRHRAPKIALHHRVGEIGPRKRFELSEKHPDQGPQGLVPALAELPEWCEKDEMVGWGRFLRGDDREGTTHRKTSQNYSAVSLTEGAESGSNCIDPFVATATGKGVDLMTKTRKQRDFDRHAKFMRKLGQRTHLSRCARKTVDQEQRCDAFSFQPEGEMLPPLEGFKINSLVLIHYSLFSIMTSQRYNGRLKLYSIAEKQ